MLYGAVYRFKLHFTDLQCYSGVCFIVLYNDKSCSRGMPSAMEGGEGHMGVRIQGVCSSM